MSNEFYAYGEKWKEAEAVMRLHAVKRWHMIDTTRIQTLAEHTGNVALLVYAIAKMCPGMFFGNAAAIAGKSVVHDLPEVFTGDFPSHSKQYMRGVDELEQKVTPACFFEDVSTNEKQLIKLCDEADGIRFIRLHGVDITARHARESLEKKFKDRIDLVNRIWPPAVATHAVRMVYFYAYEHS